jgi:CDP-diacylglycerol---glycerol-3-phosphate 3-phosphatidyltransferase
LTALVYNVKMNNTMVEINGSKQNKLKTNSKYDTYLFKNKRLMRFIPGWIPANLITALRALLLIPIYLAYRWDHLWLAFVLFLLAWFTDILDGLHARYRNQSSSLGKRLDPAVDKVFVVGLLCIFATGRLSWAIIATTITIEVIIILIAGVVAPVTLKYWHRRFKIGANVYGKIKMFLQGSALVVLMLGLNIRALQVFSEVLFWCAAVTACVSIYYYARSFEKID